MSKYFLSRLVCLCLVLAAIVPLVGCDENTKKNIAILGGAISSGIAQSRQSQSSYQRPDWKAEEYFDDPKVIRLCNAIRKRDLALIDRLIADGADINAKGVRNMTPLRWAFYQGRPWNKPPSSYQRNQPGVIERWIKAEYDAVHLAIFTKLLEHGADPNVQYIGKYSQESITERVTVNFTYFELVMKNGGDPHMVPLSSVIGRGYPLKTIPLLIDAGADVNQTDDDGWTPLMYAVHWEKYDTAIMLVEAGADWLMASPKEPDFLAPIVSTIVRRGVGVHSPAYLKLIELLEEKGANFDLEREIVSLNRIDTARMSIDAGRPIRDKLARLYQERREFYERIQQERIQQEQQTVVQ